MVKKTKKNEIIIDGNTYTQEFSNLDFVKDYETWEDTCKGVSGDAMFVENVPTLYDFLENHIFDNVRDGSVNAGKDDGSIGSIAILNSIKDIMEGRVITQKDLEDIKELYSDLRDMKDNGTEGAALDPKLILFTEKIYDKDGKKTIGQEDRYGHYRTPEYVKRRNAKDGGSREPAPSGWYSGAGNPPSFALFSESANEFANPKGLVYILEDAIEELEKGQKNTIDIGRLSGKGAVDKLAGIASVEKYFNKAINNKVFWRGGKLKVAGLGKDVKTKDFSVSPKEVKALLAAVNPPKDKVPAGRITGFTMSLTGTPLILFIKSALESASKNKGGDGYRAWTDKGQFDYRKTAKEVYGEDTGRFKPDQKVISKSWMEILKQGLSERDIENFVYSIEDSIENIVAKMFKKKYEAGRHPFGDYIVHIRKTSLTVPEMAAVSNLAFKYEFEYDDGKDSLAFASCFIAGTDDRQINDLFFDASDSEFDIEYSGDFMKLPNVKERMNDVRDGLRELIDRL